MQTTNLKYGTYEGEHTSSDFFIVFTVSFYFLRFISFF